MSATMVSSARTTSLFCNPRTLLVSRLTGIIRGGSVRAAGQNRPAPGGGREGTGGPRRGRGRPPLGSGRRPAGPVRVGGGGERVDLGVAGDVPRWHREGGRSAGFRPAGNRIPFVLATWTRVFGELRRLGAGGGTGGGRGRRGAVRRVIESLLCWRRGQGSLGSCGGWWRDGLRWLPPCGWWRGSRCRRSWCGASQRSRRR